MGWETLVVYLQRKTPDSPNCVKKKRQILFAFASI